MQLHGPIGFPQKENCTDITDLSSTRMSYLPVVDELAVERFGAAYSSGAVAPRRVKEHGAAVGVDDDSVWTPMVCVPRPRMRTVAGQFRTSWRRPAAVVVARHRESRAPSRFTDSSPACHCRHIIRHIICYTHLSGIYNVGI